ncbi:alpha/beta fold hydrolase [Sphingobium sp. TCM1]|uniref:alpha/beta fold hydrolase n=1 Tax=Sphingobium sp. TCM1 TaxID=453246 RepID=UPI000A651A06|nr:alpha/beta hydrolase [Sphingobium sp. TCM1]
MRLAASAWGDPANPPVCFFHGGGQSRRSWAGAARAVGEAGYLGLTFDLRGHGDSDWANDGDYDLGAYARDVGRLIDQLHGTVTLVGASRGGQAALVGGARHQPRIRLVMLADVSPRTQTDGVDAIRQFLRRSLSGFAHVDEAADALAAYLAQPRVANAAGLRKAMREENGRLFWHWDPRTAALEFISPPSEQAAMEQAAQCFRRPLVLVRAEHASLVTDEAVVAFRSLAPQLVVEEASGTHHMFTGDQNDIFAARLLHHLGNAVG